MQIKMKGAVKILNLKSYMQAICIVQAPNACAYACAKIAL